MPQASPSRPAPTALAWLIGFVLSSAPLGATQPVEVLVSTAGPGTPETKVECTLRAVNGENTLEWTIKAPWSGVLDVPVEQAWKFSVEAPGFWAPETTLDVAAGARRLELGLHPAGAISGKLQTPEAAEPPPTLLLELASPPARQAERNSTSSPIEVPCPVSKGFFICKLPAGRLDLKLQVSGYAPRYLWATEVATGETTDLGTLHLQRGGSVVGWVEVAGPTDEGDTPIVVLEPPVMGWKLDPRDASRQALRAASTHADERGFFSSPGWPREVISWLQKSLVLQCQSPC
ncbi:MAG: hypothetical protein HC897_13955 [Thermoanaerobaculia bacterium]|nr:hypothetical protein [Thermoanaerobaculia bacterium]